MRRGALVVSIILLVLLVAPLVTLNSAPTRHTEKSIVIQRTTPEKIIIRETKMTLPFEMKVLIEDKYGTYNLSDETLDDLVDALESKYGFTVNATSVDNITYNESTINQYWLIIIPNPQYGNLTLDQQKAIVKFVNETKGYVWAMGSSSYYKYHINVHTLNNISQPFGIEFLYDQVIDPTNNTGGTYGKYHPIAYVWAKNSLASDLSSGYTYKIKYYQTTTLNITNPNLNNTKLTMYKLAIGDDDTNTTSGKVQDGDILYSAMVITKSGGLLFLSGGTFVSDYDYYSSEYNNGEFAEKLIEYGLSRDLVLTRFEYPKEPAIAGRTLYINITIRNNANVNITNVHVGLEFSGALNLLNDSNIHNISLLEPGQEINVTFAFSVSGTSDVVMEAKAWSDDTNVVGYQKRVTFQTLGLILEASITPTYLVLGNFDHVKLTINVTNLAVNPNATNVNVSISLPEGVSTENDLFYHFDVIYNGTSQIVELNITANTTGKKIISISLESKDLGTASTEVEFGVYATPFIIYDQGHEQYYTADRLSKFVSLLREYGDVYINNGTLDTNLIGNASLIILPIPGVETHGSSDPSKWEVPKPLSSDEINDLIEYVNKGGKLIVMATWYRYILDPTLHGLNNVTSPFSIFFQDAEIVDDESNANKPYYPILMNLQKHPIASDVESVIAASSTIMTIAGDVEAILRGNPTSYAVANETNSYEYAPIGINGSAIVAIAAVETDQGGRLVAFGGASMLSDSWYENNSQLIKNTFDWIFGDTEKPTVTIDAVNITDSEGNVVGVNLTITAEDNLALKSLVVTINGTEKYRNEDLLTHRYVYTFTIEESGTYEVTVTVQDYAGLTAEETVVVKVPAPPPQPIPTWVYITAGAAAVVIVIVVAVYLLKKKKE